jgi:hypothetical protein
MSRIIPSPMRGTHYDAFWGYLRRMELRFQQCLVCKKWRYPPDEFCPWCLSDRSSWELTEGNGRLLSWATFHRRYFDTINPPYIVAAVQIPEGLVVCASMDNTEASGLHLEMEVKPSFEAVSLEDGQPWTLFNWIPA